MDDVNCDFAHLSQVSFVRKVEHRKQDGTLLIGYEYTYDLLGRVVQSVERPSGDTTIYAYTDAGRLESEQRTGQVWYYRKYGYNPDGSRAEVLRDDALNGSHWDIYLYEEASGRLQSVLDVWTGEVHQFVWNAEGTLARWQASGVDYARAFRYDEEGRLTKTEQDYGDGNLQVAYEYGYNSDGAKVWKRDTLNQQEYRYLCRIGCGGVPMRVYGKMLNDANFVSLDVILSGTNFVVHLHTYPVLIIENTNYQLIMPLANFQSYFLMITDSLGIPIETIPSIDDPFVILPRDFPYPFIPTFPERPSLPQPPRHSPPLPKLPIGLGTGSVIVGPLPSPTHPTPGNPPSPTPPYLPYPLPSPSVPQPEPGPAPGSACERLKECQKTGGDCTIECMECCNEFCGLSNYPKCYAKCSFKNGYFTPSDPLIHCGPMIIDKPKYPKDDDTMEGWIILLCKLLKAWGIINEHINCDKNLLVL